MSKTIKKFAICFALALASLTFIITGIFKMNNRYYATATEITCEGLYAEYLIGSTFTVPSATIKYGGQDYVAESGVLISPDGVAKNDTTYLLNQTGKYKVIYTVNCGNVKVRAEKEFTVTEEKFQVSSDASTVTYGDLKTAKVAGTQGLIVNFSGGDTFRYAKPIDLTEQELTEIIHMYPVVDVVEGVNVYSADMYVVTLTDCYDPSLYVNLTIQFNVDGWYYIRANASIQEEVGLYGGDDKEVNVVIDGKPYHIHKNNKWGAGGKSGGGGNPKGYGCRWLYNYSEQKVYLEELRATQLINQFNHPDIYEEKQLFKGFTTGEVYLSITPSSYSASNTTVEIQSINGESGEALKLATDYKDDKAPVIDVDYKTVDKNSVKAAKGEKFKLFDASATDINFAGDIDVSVYFNYGNEYQTEVLVEDGYFVPNTTGRYTIVYTATDIFGNQAIETVDLQCKQTNSGKGIDFNTTPLEQALAGNENVLPEYTINGLNDSAIVEIYAERQGERTKIDAETRVFIPLYHGEYEIVFNYYDSVYSYQYSYEVTSVASDEIRFLEDFVLPRHFIKDAYYSIDKLFAYSFENESPTAYDADFSVSFDKGVFLPKNPDKVLIDGDYSVQFKFAYGEKEVVSEIIPIVDVNFLSINNIERYFVGEDVTTEPSGKDVLCTANSGVEKATTSFVSPISISAFDFRFIIPESQNFTQLNVILTDYYDRTNKKVITFKEVEEKTYFTVNGGKDFEITSPNFFDDGELKRVWYNSKTKMVQNTYSMLIPFEFDFISDLCFIDIEMAGITGPSQIKLRQLNNQSLMNFGMDVGTPNIGVKQSGGSYAVGTKVTIHRAYVSDVLTPILTGDFTMSVEGPSGYVISSDDVLLDGDCPNNRSYEITLEEYGIYTVTYSVKDQNGVENSLSYRINVVDEVPPTITFKGVPNGIQVIKVGKKYTIADYQASDLFSPANKLKVTLFVYDEHFGRVSTGSKTFVPNKAGIYTIYAYCTDEAGNSSYCSYKVKAE